MALLLKHTYETFCCSLQATHIFDGLERWPTHIMFLSGGRLKVWSKAEDIPELANDQLLQLAEK